MGDREVLPGPQDHGAHVHVHGESDGEGFSPGEPGKPELVLDRKADPQSCDAGSGTLGNRERYPECAVCLRTHMSGVFGIERVRTQTGNVTDAVYLVLRHICV